MRPLRTWVGPPYRGEQIVGNAVIRRSAGGAAQEQPAEPIITEGVLELRVHGVNGGTPEQNLHDPSPIRVAGDDTAGFYRRRAELDSGPERTVEAYNWSSINSKKSIRAWWLVLFPFAAANFAGWLLPKDLDPWQRVLAQIIARLIAATTTVIATLGMALVFVDLIGVQCAGLEGCTGGFMWGWVGSVASWGPLDGEPVRLAVTYSLIPVVAFVVLWLLGRHSHAYEEYGLTPPATADPVGGFVDEIRMDRIEFWQAPDVVHVQALLHAAVTLGSLTTVLAFAIRELAPDGQHNGVLYGLGIAGLTIVFGGVLALIGVSTMRQIPRRSLRKQDAPFWKPRWSWIPVGVAVGLFGAVLWLGWITATPVAGTDQPPLDAIRNGLIAAAVTGFALVLAMAFIAGAFRTALMSLLAGVAVFLVASRTSNAVAAPYRVDALSATQWLLVAVVFAIVGIVVYRSRIGAMADPPRPQDHQSNPFWIYGSTALIVVCVVAAFLREDNLWFRLAAVLIPVVYLTVQFVVQIRHGHDYPAKETMREGVAAVIAALAVASVLTLVSSGAIFVAQRLGPAQALPQIGLGDNCPAGSICYPAEIGWFSLTVVAGFAVLIASVLLRLALLYLLRWRQQAPAICSEYDDVTNLPPGTYDEAGTCHPSHAPNRLRFAERAAKARWFANITDDIDWVVGAGVATTLTLVVAASASRIAQLLPREGQTVVFGFASWAIGFVIVGGALLVWRARESRQLRATLGILWDVMSFFPRRFHPLAPPCYAERAVIDLRNRVIHATTRGNPDATDPGCVLLAGHSEGSLISTAALLTLLPENLADQQHVNAPGHPQPTGRELEHVAFVTYGCMLQRLYSRAWPDQLPEATLIRLKSALEGPQRRDPATAQYPCPPPGRLPRWINFGRYSDYLGGRVFQELQRKPTVSDPHPPGDQRCDDIFFADPTRRWRFVGQLEWARVWRHSFDYESDTEDPRFREHIWAMARVMNGEDETAVRAEYAWMVDCLTAPAIGAAAEDDSEQKAET
jgi:hypothetical protein